MQPTQNFFKKCPISTNNPQNNRHSKPSTVTQLHSSTQNLCFSLWFILHSFSIFGWKIIFLVWLLLLPYWMRVGRNRATQLLLQYESVRDGAYIWLSSCRCLHYFYIFSNFVWWKAYTKLNFNSYFHLAA